MVEHIEKFQSNDPQAEALARGNEHASHTGMNEVRDWRSEAALSKEKIDKVNGGTVEPNHIDTGIKGLYSGDAVVAQNNEKAPQTFADFANSGNDLPTGAKPRVDYFTVSEFSTRRQAQEVAHASAHFAQTLSELQHCKWSKDIHIWGQGAGDIKYEYDPRKSLIEINGQDSFKRQAEMFAHEGYHAAHQDLAKLYGSSTPIGQREYVDIKMRQESGAFLREIRVNEEIRHSRPDLGNEPVEYAWVDPNNQTGEPRRQVMNDLLIRNGNHIDEEKSLAAIDKFLREHPAVERKPDSPGYKRDDYGRLIIDDYAQQKAGGYAGYARQDYYAQNRKSLIDKGDI